MTARVNGMASGRPSASVIAGQAAGAIPDRMTAVEVAADEDVQAGAGATAGLFAELQGHAVGGDDVIATDDAFVLDAQDLLEIDAAEGHEGRAAVSGWPAELGVEGGDKLGAHVAIGSGDRPDPGYAQLIDQAILQGAVDALAPPSGLGRVPENMLDAEPLEGAAHLRELRAIGGRAGGGGVHGPVSAVGVQRHRQAILLEDRPQSRHHGVHALAARPELRVEQLL